MNSLQQQIHSDLKNTQLFSNVQQYGREYLDQVFDRNVYPTDEALKNLDKFDEQVPASSGNAEEILQMLYQYGNPATVAATGGRYFGFVTGAVTAVGLAAKQLGSYWDQSTAMFVSSPIASKLEAVVEGWLKKLLKLPDPVVAGFVSGTFSANLCGIAAARYRLLQNAGWDVSQQGLNGAPPIRVVTGREAHSTILKALSLLGFGKNNIEFIETDDQGRIIPEKIPALDDRTLVILQAGNVNSGAFDEFSRIVTKARDAGAWVHVDGAFGLWAAATKELSHLTNGMEYAHSWAVDGHKTLNTPYDSGIVLCADREALVSALHMSGAYIVISENRDGMFYTPEMSRRGRIFELWATIKYLGTEGISEMVTEMHRRSKQFAEELDDIEGFEVLNEVVFNQVVVTCKTDELTLKVLERIQQLRECWVGGSAWRGRKVIRISVCSWATTKEDVTRSCASFKQALEQLQ